MSKSFLKGKGIEHQMSPAEMAHNEGCGIFKKAKKATINLIEKIIQGCINEIQIIEDRMSMVPTIIQ